MSTWLGTKLGGTTESVVLIPACLRIGPGRMAHSPIATSCQTNNRFGQILLLTAVRKLHRATSYYLQN